MTLRKIHLELARCPMFPEGSARHGYDFVAPLTPEGRLDVKAWPQARGHCPVRRFWNGGDDEIGQLARTRNHAWAFHFQGMDEELDEPIYHFDQHRLVEGEYVSITEHDGVQRTFRIVRVQ